MRYVLYPLRFLYLLYAFLIFLVPMVPVFLWSLAVAPWGRIKGGNLVYTACKLWADIWFLLVFIRHRNIYLHKPEKNRAYIFIANHNSYLDAAIIPKAIRHPVRPLGKVEMARVPLFGTIYKNVIVSVDRSSVRNRAKSVQILKSVLQKGISIWVFPEGTFNETGRPLKSFYDGAFRIAVETCTPIQPVLLLDLYDRMHPHSLLTLTPGKSRALFLPPVPVEGLTLKDVPILRNRVSDVMEEALCQHHASWIKEH